jgi:hypothetical protein
LLDPQGMQLSSPVVDEEAEVFLCPITQVSPCEDSLALYLTRDGAQELMEDPVVTPCGHCFERAAIVRFLPRFLSSFSSCLSVVQHCFS